MFMFGNGEQPEKERGLKEQIYTQVKDLMAENDFLIQEMPTPDTGILFIEISDSQGDVVSEESLEDLMNGIAINCDSVEGKNMEIHTNLNGLTGIKISLESQ